jgi:hypothetical protein
MRTQAVQAMWHLHWPRCNYHIGAVVRLSPSAHTPGAVAQAWYIVQHVVARVPHGRRQHAKEPPVTDVHLA